MYLEFAFDALIDPGRPAGRPFDDQIIARHGPRERGRRAPRIKSRRRDWRILRIINFAVCDVLTRRELL